MNSWYCIGVYVGMINIGHNTRIITCIKINSAPSLLGTSCIYVMKSALVGSVRDDLYQEVDPITMHGAGHHGPVLLFLMILLSTTALHSIIYKYMYI